MKTKKLSFLFNLDDKRVYKHSPLQLAHLRALRSEYMYIYMYMYCSQSWECLYFGMPTFLHAELSQQYQFYPNLVSLIQKLKTVKEAQA